MKTSSSQRPVRLALVGTGGMSLHHIQGYQRLAGEVEVVACCDVRPEAAQAFAAQHGIPRVYADWAQMLEEEPLDAIDNVTPDPYHAPIAIAAAEHGLHLMSEKPLATNVAEGERMLAAVERAGVVNMVNFTYRNAAALQAGHAVIAEGRLGRILHVECSYLQSWLVANYWGDWRTSPGWLWRLSSAHGSGGTLGDIGCHLFDSIKFLAGPLSRLQCNLRTFDKGLGEDRSGPYVFDANDSFVASLEFTSGALGVAHSSRWASGHQNSLRFKVYGDRGAIEIDLDRSYTAYRICAGEDLDAARWQEVEVEPTPDNYARFIRAIRTGETPQSGFANALDILRYTEFSALSSAEGRWVEVGPEAPAQDASIAG